MALFDMTRLALALIVLTAVTGSVRAEETPNHPLLNDRFRVSVGGFYAESNTSARLGSSSGGAGVDVSFEDALGLEERKWIGEFSAYWRISSRWRLDVDYFRLQRSANRTLAQDVSWGDNTFTVGTNVNSSLTISDLRTSLGYSFFRRTDKEVGIALGVHTLGYKASIEGRNGGARSESVTAPLPVLSLYGQFALTDTWALSLRQDWLSLEYDKYSGSIRATKIDVVYQPFKHVAFGLGMHSLDLKLDVQNDNSKFQARSGLRGPAAFMSVSY
jgi:hypothetical protein